MSAYAHLQNRDNRVLALVDWDGVTEVPIPEPRPIDCSLIPVPDGEDPWLGDVWDGQHFQRQPDSTDPTPPIEGRRRRGKHSDDDD